jgi:hypothetical protein
VSMGNRGGRHEGAPIGMAMMPGELIQVGWEQVRMDPMHISQLVGLARDAREFSGKQALRAMGDN